jgi:preprotein translocase subunit SecG
MKIVFDIFHIFVTVSLIVVILLQSKGVGLSATFGGGGTFYRSKRGVEKLLFRLTIFLALLFMISSIAGLLL